MQNVNQMIEDSKNATLEELFTTVETPECDKCSNDAKYTCGDFKFCDKCVMQVFRDNKNEIAIDYIDEYLEEIVEDNFDKLCKDYEVKEMR